MNSTEIEMIFILITVNMTTNRVYGEKIKNVSDNTKTQNPERNKK